jgi:hypothetical protein
MGVDYYTQDNYCFVYKTEDGKEDTFYEEAGCRSGHYIYDDYDSDIMTLSDYLDEMSKKVNKNKPTLYENGKWTCTQECQDRLQAILKKNSNKNVIKIYKTVFVWPRY